MSDQQRAERRHQKKLATNFRAKLSFQLWFRQETCLLVSVENHQIVYISLILM